MFLGRIQVFREIRLIFYQMQLLDNFVKNTITAKFARESHEVEHRRREAIVFTRWRERRRR